MVFLQLNISEQEVYSTSEFTIAYLLAITWLTDSSILPQSPGHLKYSGPAKVSFAVGREHWKTHTVSHIPVPSL